MFSPPRSLALRKRIRRFAIAPADAATLAHIERLHWASEKPCSNASKLESGSGRADPQPIKNTQTGTAYRKFRRGAGEPQTTIGGTASRLQEDWSTAINGVVAVINLGRVPSMYIADASAFNNEMTKVIRMVWSMVKPGRDCRPSSWLIITDAN